MSAVKTRVGCPRNNIVDAVAKFVEEGSYFIMTKQGRSG
jgi:hypothetical protein